MNEQLTDILSENKKEIVSLNELIECNEKSNSKDETSGKKNENEKNNNCSNLNLKIPKMNPLSGMSKNYNKFDIVPGNAMSGLMMSYETSSFIPESKKEE